MAELDGGASRGALVEVRCPFTDMHAEARTGPVFLLSPAHCGGRRAALLRRPESSAELAVRLRLGTLTLGEAFSFMSGLYFRGKLAYARAFAADVPGVPAVLVITPTRGLLTPDVPVTTSVIEEFAAMDIASGDTGYRAPLERDLAGLAARLSSTSRVVLLGSIASDKYVEVLRPALGDRLHYPASFVGRGDMSRGGLLLRSAASGVELDYVPFHAGAVRHGPRPARLTPLPRRDPRHDDRP